MQITASDSLHMEVSDARVLKAQPGSLQPAHKADAGQATTVEQGSMRWCAEGTAGDQDE